MGSLAAATGQYVLHLLTYNIQRASLARNSFGHRLLVLACVSISCVGAGGYLYKLVSGTAWSCALFKSYGVLFRAPGFVVSQEQTLAASLVLNTIFIFGVFVFAVLIGMISDEIKQQIHDMRNGEVALQLQGHTLVLNWNSLTLSLLRQLYHAQHDPKHSMYKRPVVVLADRSKAEMDAAVFSATKNLTFEIFVRSGRPSKQPDLQRVAAHAAATVILLQPEPCSSETAAEALKATTLISLRCLQLTEASNSSRFQQQYQYQALHFARCSSRRGNNSMRVVVQQPNLLAEDDLMAFLHSTTASISNVQGVRLLNKKMLDRLVAQTSVQPGVAQAFREIVRAGADCPQLCWCEVEQQLAGSRYKQAQGMFPHAVVLGVLSAADRQLQLNPSDELQLCVGDRLLGFSRQAKMRPRAAADSASSSTGWRRLTRPLSRATSMTSKHLRMVPSSSMVTADSTPRFLGPGRAMKVIVLGWPETALSDLLTSLQGTAPGGSTFTVLHQCKQQQAAQQPDVAYGACSSSSRQRQVDSCGLKAGEQPNAQQQQEQQQEQQQQRVACSHLHVAEPCSVRALLGAGIADADSVIIGGALAPAGSADADAMVVAALLAVQQALQQTTGAAAAWTGPDQQQQGPSSQKKQAAGQQQSLTGSLNHTRGSAISGSSRLARVSSGSSGAIRLHVVAVLSSYSVRRAAQVFLGSMLMRNFSYEIMVLDEYAGAMLVQVAQDPAISLVMNQLLVQPSGKGLFMWPVFVLGFKYGSSISFSQLSNAARRHHCTALGYRRADGRMLLAPSAADEVCFEEGDRVVVIADSQELSH